MNCPKCGLRPAGTKHRWCSKCQNERRTASPSYLAKRKKGGPVVHSENRSREERRRIRQAALKQWYLQTIYGLSEVEYRELLRAQDGRCAICRGVEKDRCFSVDHDHATLKIRGLLCNACNPGLGLFQDSPELLRAAADYLEGPGTGLMVRRSMTRSVSHRPEQAELFDE